jgi:hypothetical protein
VSKQLVLDLTDETDGNANGIGTADFATVRAASKMSFAMTYPNGLTSTVVGPVALPMVLPSDRLAFAAAIQTCNAVGREPRVMRIANTLRLDEFTISPSLIDDARLDARIEIVDEPTPLSFGADDNLLDLGSPGRVIQEIRLGR